MNTMKADRKGKAPYTEKTNTHVPSGQCVHSTFAYGDVPHPLKMYRDKDSVEKFVEHIEEEVRRLYPTFPQQPMIELTDVLKREHQAAEKCHLCLKEFNDPQNKKVRDHCHYTGLYQGATHNNCNLKFRIQDHITIAFHSLSGYDAHLYIKELGMRFNKNVLNFSFNVKINVKLAVVSNKDGTKVCKNIQLRFIDSCRFLALSLNELASNLNDDQCKQLREFYKEEEVFRLQAQGCIPIRICGYGWKKFEETSLPPKDAFYSRPNMKGISDQDYGHAQQIWNRITSGHKNITLGDLQ